MGLSGLQRQAIKLVRDVVRAARSKPPELRSAILAALRQEFAKNKGVPRSNVMQIEHLLRKGAFLCI